MVRVRDNIKEIVVSQTQLAKALGISQPRINQLIDEGIVIRDETSKVGEVLLFESLRNWFLSKKTTDDGVNFWKERGLHEKAKRELAQVKLAERRGELYEAKAVETFVTEMIMTARSKLLILGRKVAPRFSEADKICAAIDYEVNEILTELAADGEGFEKGFERMATAAEDDGEPMG